MFGWLKRVTKDDPVFGSMLYMGDKLQYWEGKAHFPPTGTVVEVFVDGPSAGDMSQQHEFFSTVCSKWADMIAAISARIREEYDMNGAEELKITGLDIRNAPFAEDTGWEVYLASETSDFSYHVEMKGTTPEAVSFDC